MVEQPFDTEDMLQELIGQYPELLAGDQMRWDDPLRWILIRREMPIEDWAVDHLLLDQDARPTLVEVKRGASSDNRRKVVGQMLDYAATANSVWSGDEMRRAFEEDASKRGIDPIEELCKLLQPDDEIDAEDLADEFWKKAATNLAANRLRLLFVADEIPLQLERVVKFLNEQTWDNLDVLAVEIKQYPAQFGSALVSKVTGQVEAKQSAQRSGARRSEERQEEIFGRCTPAGRKALQALLDAAQKAGAYTNWGNNGLTISKYNSMSGLWPYVVRFNWWSENDNTPLELVMRRHEIYPLPSELRAVLQKWIDKFKEDDFVVSHTNFPRHDEGWAATEEDFVKHVDLITKRLQDTLNEIEALRS